MSEIQNGIPESWAWVRIDEIVAINPREFDRPPKDDDELSFIPMAAVEAGSGQLDPSGRRNWREVKKGFTRFQERDVLFAKITPCMENAKFALAINLQGGRGAGSTEFHVLRTTPSLNSKLLLYYLLQESFRREARACMQGEVPPVFWTGT